MIPRCAAAAAVGGGCVLQRCCSKSEGCGARVRLGAPSCRRRRCCCCCCCCCCCRCGEHPSHAAVHQHRCYSPSTTPSAREAQRVDQPAHCHLASAPPARLPPHRVPAAWEAAARARSRRVLRSSLPALPPSPGEPQARKTSSLHSHTSAPCLVSPDACATPCDPQQLPPGGSFFARS